MIVGLDHLLIAVEDLPKAMELYRRLGFQVLVGGEHPTVGTHNALVSFSDGCYLELIGVKKPELAQQFPFGQQVLEALAKPNRLAGYALESDDVTGDVQAVRDRGLTIAKAPPGGRVRPDGQQVSWRTAHPENPRLPFLIQDLTPRQLRVPPTSEGLGGATRIGWVEVGASDFQPTITSFMQLLGERPVEGKFSLQRGAIHLSQSFSGDGVQMVALLTQDVASLARDWETRGVPFYDEVIRGIGRVLVPRDTGGARLSVCQIR
ncbi:MAG: VOC family protein [Nitrospira sp.]|nr:VOC family protein [Nitrospira sp.]